jgi:hypothetical protein
VPGEAVTHAEIVQAIEARGGYVAFSVKLDSQGNTPGARRERKEHSCSRCGRGGHSIQRCNGIGQPPKPTHEQRRSRGWLATAADPFAETKRILAERAARRRR